MIDVIIVEDDLEILKAFTQIFHISEDLNVIDTFTNSEDFLSSIDDITVDVVLMDIGLPRMSGIECVEIVKQKKPEIQFLMFTNFDEDQKVFDALRAGANGYVLKNAEIQTVIQSRCL